MTLHPYMDKEPRIGENVFTAPGARIVGDVVVEDGVSVWFNAVVRGDMAPVRVGARTNVQDCCVLHVDHDYPLVVGRDVTVGHQAVLHGCTVEDGALVGMGARVLNGAVIGEEALVAAGALVLEEQEIPPRTLVVGMPARVARNLTDDELEKLRTSPGYYRGKAGRYIESGVNTLGADAQESAEGSVES
jgi:carbonic anhydrase/acetyltransferase-like protein (isoleucine patch superfamily)